MLKKISRRKFLKDHPYFPQANNYHNKFTYPDVYENYILYTEARSIPDLCRKVSKELAKLLSVLKLKNIAFQGDSSIPWLYANHQYKPVQQAYQYLLDNNVSPDFNGALQTDDASLATFSSHLFWLVRCNGVLSIPHFTDDDYNIVGYICQYGNIHWSNLNKETDDLFNDALVKTKLKMTDDSICTGRIYKRTSTYGAILRVE
jgi:hypothetical protein